MDARLDFIGQLFANVLGAVPADRQDCARLTVQTIAEQVDAIVEDARQVALREGFALGRVIEAQERLQAAEERVAKAQAAGAESLAAALEQAIRTPLVQH